MSKFIVIEATTTVSYGPAHQHRPVTDLVVSRLSFWEGGEHVTEFDDIETARDRLWKAYAAAKVAAETEGCEVYRDDYDKPNVLRFMKERGWVQSDVMKIWTIEKV